MSATVLAAYLGNHILLANRARVFERLLEGDPIAWTLLVAALAIFGTLSYVKANRKKHEITGEPGSTTEKTDS